MSTNKVYGDAPNGLPLVERQTRWEYARPEHHDGIDQTIRIDQNKHTIFGIFGANNVAADVMVQEYGRYFGMKTACYRGVASRAQRTSSPSFTVSWLTSSAVSREATVSSLYGMAANKCVTTCTASTCAVPSRSFIQLRVAGRSTTSAAVAPAACRLIEAIRMVEDALGKKLAHNYVAENRSGDHICYISNLKKLRAHYPRWRVTRSLADIIEDFFRAPAA
jgi:CDP-paratose 2-epimerase